MAEQGRHDPSRAAEGTGAGAPLSGGPAPHREQGAPSPIAFLRPARRRPHPLLPGERIRKAFRHARHWRRPMAANDNAAPRIGRALLWAGAGTAGLAFLVLMIR